MSTINRRSVRPVGLLAKQQRKSFVSKISIHADQELRKQRGKDEKIIIRLLKINSSSNKSHWNCRQISTCLKVSEPFIGEICVLALTIPALGVSLQMTCTSPKAPASLITASCKMDPSCTMLIFSEVAFVKLKIKDGF